MKRTIAKSLFYLALITTAIFVLSGYGYQWNIWELGTAFTLLRYSAYGAIGLSVVLFGVFFYVKDTGFKSITLVALGFLMTISVTVTALYWQHQAGQVPPIHDITTDLNSPPEFVAMVRLRADAPNPPDYAGEETAAAQREAYPNVQPLIVNRDLQEVMDSAVLLVTDRGWELVAVNRNDGRIEATEKLAWFGFKDDVVLRFSEEEDGTRVDMRSKSRIGRSDIGVNADRILRFLRDLEDELNS